MNEPWLERWRDGRTGWHESAGNRGLHEHWTATGCRVLVPLCGKSPDLLWLEERGNDVVGIELSEIAARAFFDENDIEYRRDSQGCFVAIGRRLSIVCGDYFAFSESGFDAHYDRGALVALPLELRPRYAAHTRALLRPGAFQLVVSLDYDQSVADGPPYAVGGREITSYWHALERVDAYDVMSTCPPKFVDAGITALEEVVWRTPRRS
ncbi:MAG: thiopurine S-methyltransferase [Woeseiaceae bacterium]|nr:thiopurine S-methyltransferase [Woeseiaceae bacterium]